MRETLSHGSNKGGHVEIFYHAYLSKNMPPDDPLGVYCLYSFKTGS